MSRLDTLTYLWKSDLYRNIGGRLGWKAALRAYWAVPGFRFLFWYRLANVTRGAGGLWKLVYLLGRVMHRRQLFKFGISIPHDTQIGAGLYIGHFGGIVVNRHARIGRNVNISQGVTIGQVNRGERQGVPDIGDNVYIGPGAVIIGAIRIGNGCAIGANAVVTRDLPDNAVAVGVPAKVISLAGNAGYVDHCDYPQSA
jgi:serine O-acetyltransferase